MGYYTNHELQIIEGDVDNVDFESEISKEAGYSWCFDDSIKWYNCHNDMKNFSKKYPNTIFKIIGEGEEAGDIWHAYFQNGKMQLCEAQITFEEFNKQQLK